MWHLKHLLGDYLEKVGGERSETSGFCFGLKSSSTFRNAFDLIVVSIN